MGMLRANAEYTCSYTRLLPAAVMNIEYRANKRLYEFTKKKKRTEKRKSSESGKERKGERERQRGREEEK